MFNIRSWNAHIKHFLSDKVYSDCCDLMCFTETGSTDTRIDQHIEGWKDIHEPTSHGLAICYKEDKVKIIQEWHLPTRLEVLPVLIEIHDERILLVLVYRAPGALHSFIHDLIQTVRDISSLHRILLVGDFNLDQRLQENVDVVDPLVTQFGFHQRSQYTTHIHGGILDLVFDDRNSDTVSWIPSPYSDHFVLCIQI